MDDVLHLELTLPHTRQDIGTEEYSQVKDLIKKVKPNWKDLEVQILHGGAISLVMHVTCSNQDECPLVVKVFDLQAKSGQLLPPPDLYCEMMVAAYEAGAGARVHAKFSNGLVYDYIPGLMAKPDVIPHNAHIQKLIAEELAKLHSIDLMRYPTLSKLELQSYQIVDDCLSKLPQAFSDIVAEGSDRLDFTIEEYEAEINFLKNYIDFTKHPIGLLHGDTWWTNIIYDQEIDKVALLDYDLACVSYNTIDLAYYFIHGNSEYIPMVLCMQHPLKQHEKKQFLTHYRNKMVELKGPKSDFPDIDSLMSMTQPSELYVELYLIGIFLHHLRDVLPDRCRVCNWLWHTYKALKSQYVGNKEMSVDMS